MISNPFGIQESQHNVIGDVISDVISDLKVIILKSIRVPL